jgi:hypothetical protein
MFVSVRGGGGGPRRVCVGQDWGKNLRDGCDGPRIRLRETGPKLTHGAGCAADARAGGGATLVACLSENVRMLSLPCWSGLG